MKIEETKTYKHLKRKLPKENLEALNELMISIQRAVEDRRRADAVKKECSRSIRVDTGKLHELLVLFYEDLGIWQLGNYVNNFIQEL